jgi:uncharacterized repeat protein (TIGR01451 family)
MKHLYFCLLIFMLSTSAHAQGYVSIPDPEFVSYLQTNYPTCMNGSQLDTTCSEILSVTHLDIEWVSVSNLDGLQYFDGLTNLRVTGIIKTLSIPAYPPSLITLECWSGSNTVMLGKVPPSLDTLSLDAVAYTHVLHDSLIYLEHTRGYSGYTLPADLKYFSCYNNNLTTLPPLPASLLSLNCGYNLLTDLGSLPPQLKFLNCANNSYLTALPELPATLETLDCMTCDLAVLPELPSGLQELVCYENQLTVLPELPTSLKNLMVINNKLTALPALPAGLTDLYCSLNQIEVLPELPAALIVLYCTNNELTELPVLPDGLKAVFCSYNKLTSLPELPVMLDSLFCDHNLLTSLPALNTPSLGGLFCHGNNIKCLPFLPNSLMSFSIDPSITCIPNKPTNPGFYGDYPICTDETSGCTVYPLISGYVFVDNDLDGTMDPGETPYPNAPLRMNPGNYMLLANEEGRYDINVQAGTYTFSIDEDVLPYFSSLPASYSVTVSEYGERSENHNFGLHALELFNDLSIVLTPNGLVRPGRNAGYSLVCKNKGTTVVSGSVSLTYSSLLENPSSEPLFDSEASNVLTWNLSDLFPGEVRRIKVLFTASTTAQMNEPVALTALLTTTGDDENLNDNSDGAMQSIISSYDPNFKEVSPAKDLSVDEVPLQDPFTYTVHFQNTGNDTAFVVMIKDTISTNFEIEEIRTIATSHDYTFTMKNNVAVWKFDEILLPDSTKDEPNSHGFVKYRIIPKHTLEKDDRIENTAFIFFDYNVPVETNTTLNRVVAPTSIQENSGQARLNLYPNPSKGVVSVALYENEGQQGTVKIYNSQGMLIRTIDQSSLPDVLTVDLSTEMKGIYYIQVTGLNSSKTGKIELY